MRRNRLYAVLAVILTTAVFGGCSDERNTRASAVKMLEPEMMIPTETAPAKTPVSSEENTAAAPEAVKDAPADEIKETAPPPPSTIAITISAAGDVTLGNYHEQDYSYSFNQTYEKLQDNSYFFQNVYDIFANDDMTIVNLEGVLTQSELINEGRTYNIKGEPKYVEILTAGSVEAVSFANNHRWDYGEEGSRDTIAALNGADIKYACDAATGIYEAQGIRIGFVSVNESSQGAAVENYLENGIRKLKEEQVNLILACCHWGTERENYPEAYQRELGKKCIDWGADLVLGHHPHVLQGVEEYQGKYIVYSLANFCFGANRNPTDKDTMIFQQTFTFMDGEKQETKEIRIIPCSVSSIATRNDYCPTPAEGEDAVRIINRINEYSRDFGVVFSEDGYLEKK